jgi:hypothetical protein
LAIHRVAEKSILRTSSSCSASLLLPQALQAILKNSPAISATAGSWVAAARDDRRPSFIVSLWTSIEQVAAIDDRQLTPQREQTETNDE